ncbi:hemolysin family protein [Synechococcus sp. PCC 7336]|uniref:hemolysin family protein n=1 Tax=Synechococcus sp. PCC 7336 TaxID=195250 RepID=UPI00034B9F1A|nr:hemolysin family protein [Synechococcus sp. PCC 7336]
MIVSILFFLLCIVASAGFSGAESAIVGIDNLKLQALIEAEGDQRIYRLVQTQRTRFITTLLVGNNLVNIAAAAIATSLGIQLLGDSLGPLVATAVTTISVLIFSEILPKSLAVSNPLPAFKAVVVPVYWLSRILGPTVRMFEWLVEKTIQIFRVPSRRHQASVKDLELLVNILGRQGQLDFQKHRLFRGALAMDVLQARDVAIPRVRMETIGHDRTLQDVIDRCLATGYSRIPVQEESKDEIIGIIHLKQALRHLKERGNDCVTAAMQEPTFIPATKRVGPLLRSMLRSRQHLVIVVDEFGGTSGLIALEDLLEELVGDIFDESDLSPLLARRKLQSRS